MRIRYGAFFVLFVFSCIAPLAACRSEPDRPRASTVNSFPEAEWFTERAETSGLTFIHFNGMSGQFYFPEIMPPGVALFDYDNDGDLDVFIVQGRMLGRRRPRRHSRSRRDRCLSGDGCSETIWRSA
jgi:hypothetical protein